MFTKKWIKNFTTLANEWVIGCDGKNKLHTSYVITDTETRNYVAVLGGYSCVDFNNLTSEQQTELSNIIKENNMLASVIGEFKVSKYFDKYVNHASEYYGDPGLITEIDLNELKDRISEIKQKYHTYCKMYKNIDAYNRSEEIYDIKFGTKYNVELLYDTAKIVTKGNKIKAHFSTERNNPIILHGKYGTGFVLPVMYMG